jgi:hypothetical protein
MSETISFESKFYALRKSKDGVIVSFVVHPQDVPNDLLTAPIGEQFMVALAPYVETAEVVPIAKARKRPETEGEKAVMRAVILCGNTDFQFWASRFMGSDRLADIEDYVRERCGVQSRAELKTNTDALKKFYALDLEFREWMARR